MFKKTIYLKPKTPGLRHRNKIKVLSSYSNIFFKKKKKNNNKKFFFFNKTCNIINIFKKKLNYIVTDYICNYKPYKSFFKINDIYNNNCFIPGIKNIFIGSIISIKYNYLKNNNLFGKTFLLKNIPFYKKINNIFDKFNIGVTMCLASGCVSTRLNKKKKKLICIRLPSKQEKFLLPDTNVFLNTTYNYKNNILVEGKWGNALHKYKKINVRGVAMNPIDHPNGGRNKSPSPEKSPWSWVAKKTK